MPRAIFYMRRMIIKHKNIYSKFAKLWAEMKNRMHNDAVSRVHDDDDNSQLDPFYECVCCMCGYLHISSISFLNNEHNAV